MYRICNEKGEWLTGWTLVKRRPLFGQSGMLPVVCSLETAQRLVQSCADWGISAHIRETGGLA